MRIVTLLWQSALQAVEILYPMLQKLSSVSCVGGFLHRKESSLEATFIESCRSEYATVSDFLPQIWRMAATVSMLSKKFTPIAQISCVAKSKNVKQSERFPTERCLNNFFPDDMVHCYQLAPVLHVPGQHNTDLTCLAIAVFAELQASQSCRLR